MTPAIESSTALLSHLVPVTRRGIGIGGSDIAALVGMSPWATPFDVYNSIMEGRQDGQMDERKKWGRRLEKIIAEAYGEENKKQIVWLDRTFAHPDRPWQLMTPDFLIPEDREGADSKCVAVDQAWKFGEEGTDEVPDYYKLQAHWYLDISGLDAWRIVPLIGGNTLCSYVIAPDEEVHGILREAGDRFIKDHVLKNVRPKPGGSIATDDWLKRKFSKASLGFRPATVDELDLAREYRAAKEKCDAAEREKKAVKQELQLRIAEHEGIVLPGGRGSITYKEVTRAPYSVGGASYRNFRLNTKRGGL